MPSITDSEKVHDCLMNVRYKYRLASPVTEAIIRRFSADKTVAVKLYDASRFLPQSRPVFHIQHNDDFLICGALGLDYVTVTYTKGGRLAGTITRVEEAIRCL